MPDSLQLCSQQSSCRRIGCLASGWKHQGKEKGVAWATISEGRCRDKKSLGFFRELQAQVVAGPEAWSDRQAQLRKGLQARQGPASVPTGHGEPLKVPTQERNGTRFAGTKVEKGHCQPWGRVAWKGSDSSQVGWLGNYWVVKCGAQSSYQYKYADGRIKDERYEDFAMTMKCVLRFLFLENRWLAWLSSYSISSTLLHPHDEIHWYFIKVR